MNFVFCLNTLVQKKNGEGLQRQGRRQGSWEKQDREYRNKFLETDYWNKYGVRGKGGEVYRNKYGKQAFRSKGRV